MSVSIILLFIFIQLFVTIHELFIKNPHFSTHIINHHYQAIILYLFFSSILYFKNDFLLRYSSHVFHFKCSSIRVLTSFIFFSLLSSLYTVLFDYFKIFSALYDIFFYADCSKYLFTSPFSLTL